MFREGSYLVLIMEKVVFAFTSPDVKSVEKEVRHAKKRRVQAGSPLPDSVSFTGSTDSDLAMSLRDEVEGEYSFKNRLVHRDKGCIVCHAKGTPKDYLHEDHSRHFHGAHIFPLSMQESWNRRQHQNLITDPYTSLDSFNVKRNKKDPRRINSLENGLLLCLEHHVMYNAFEYSINPTTHEIYAFSSAASDIHRFIVTRPWSLSLSRVQFQQDPRFPPPHPAILRDHFMTAIFQNMKAAAKPTDNYEEDDSDLDIAELEAVDSEWLGASESGEYLEEIFQRAADRSEDGAHNDVAGK